MQVGQDRSSEWRSQMISDQASSLSDTYDQRSCREYPREKSGVLGRQIIWSSRRWDDITRLIDQFKVGRLDSNCWNDGCSAVACNISINDPGRTRKRYQCEVSVTLISIADDRLLYNCAWTWLSGIRKKRDTKWTASSLGMYYRRCLQKYASWWETKVRCESPTNALSLPPNDVDISA